LQKVQITPNASDIRKWLTVPNKETLPITHISKQTDDYDSDESDLNSDISAGSLSVIAVCDLLYDQDTIPTFPFIKHHDSDYAPPIPCVHVPMNLLNDDDVYEFITFKKQRIRRMIYDSSDDENTTLGPVEI